MNNQKITSGQPSSIANAFMPPAKKLTEEEGVLHTFSKKRQILVIFQDPKNWKRGIKIGLHLVAYKVLQCWALSHALFGTEASAKKAHLTVGVYKAVQLGHSACKMGTAWAYSVFGDDLCCPSRNIAQKEVLRNEEDVAAARDMVQKILESNLLQRLGGNKKQIAELKTELINETIAFGAIAGGICAGACFSLIRNYLNGQKTLEEIVNNDYTKGMPPDAAANQAIYELFHNHKKALGKGIDALKKTFQWDFDFPKPDDRVDLVIAYLNGLQPTRSSNQCISLPEHSRFETTQEQLKNTPLESLEDGAYTATFETEGEPHITVFIKEKDKTYIFDPNFGLIRCPEGAYSQQMLKLLSLYAPSEKNPKVEKYYPENRQLIITKYELMKM